MRPEYGQPHSESTVRLSEIDAKFGLSGAGLLQYFPNRLRHYGPH